MSDQITCQESFQASPRAVSSALRLAAGFALLIGLGYCLVYLVQSITPKQEIAIVEDTSTTEDYEMDGFDNDVIDYLLAQELNIGGI